MAPTRGDKDGNGQSGPIGTVAKNVKYIGVRYRSPGRYGAVIRDKVWKRDVWLGTCNSAEEAARAYDAAARHLRGKSAKTNFTGPQLDPVPEMTCHNQSYNIQRNSTTLDSTPAALDRRSRLNCVPADFNAHHAHRLHAAIRSADIIRQRKLNIVNGGVGAQGMADPGISSTSEIDLHIAGPHLRPISCPPTNRMDWAALVQQPPMATGRLGEDTAVSHISTHKIHEAVQLGMVNNLPSAAGDCYDYSSGGLLKSQVSHPPGPENTGPSVFDLNLPPPEREVVSVSSRRISAGPRLTLDLNLLPPEE